MGDLTLASFAYLRTPLILAGLAFPDWCAVAQVSESASRAYFAMAVMMVLFVHAARLASGRVRSVSYPRGRWPMR